MMQGMKIKLQKPCRHVSLLKTFGRENHMEQWFVQFKRLTEERTVSKVQFFISDEAIHALMLLYIDSTKTNGTGVA